MKSVISVTIAKGKSICVSPKSHIREDKMEESSVRGEAYVRVTARGGSLTLSRANEENKSFSFSSGTILDFRFLRPLGSLLT